MDNTTQVAEHNTKVAKRDRVAVALSQNVNDGLVPMSFALGMLFGVLAVVDYAFFPGGVAGPTSAAAGVTSALLLGLGYVVRRRMPPVSWGHWIAFLIVALVHVDNLVFVSVTTDAMSSFGTGILIVGIGCVFISTPWAMGTIAAVFVSWYATILANGLPAFRVEYVLIQLSCIVLAITVHGLRVRFLHKIERLQAMDRAHRERLEEALERIKRLSGMLPICASCKNIRDDKGYWSEIETYISEHSEALFSHGICPECAQKLYPERFAGADAAKRAE